jgi:GxxExxY protein
MNSKYERANYWSGIVIGAAMEVHRDKGPGLLESIYDKCLCLELQLRHVPAVSQMQVEIDYKGFTFLEPLKLDFYVDDCLLVELKAVESVLPIHKAQLLGYMKLLAAPIGLLINFHALVLKDGVNRMMLPGAQS